MKATLFDTGRLQMTDAIRLTAESLAEYGRRYNCWCIAWSGGKDSTTVLTLITWMIESGMVPRPKRIVVLYADTRQELPPLWLASADLRDELAEREIEVRSVMAPVDRRMWVYILGRGVPPPNNNTLRYCTRQIKIEPMLAAVAEFVRECGSKVLMLTGVRIGESAARDQRIVLSCSANGAECGQGWFQQSADADTTDTLAPILHWRVCHVWEWLHSWAPRSEFGDWSTRILAEAYGGRDGDEAQEINARTGCICCPLASRDAALDAIIRLPQWSYLSPLKRIRTEIYEWLRLPKNRLRKRGGERRRDGTLCENQQRMGPILLESRIEGLQRLLAIQHEINTEAKKQRRPVVDLLNAEEESRIREMIGGETWPDGWDGSEPAADILLPPIRKDGSIQNLMFDENAENRPAFTLIELLAAIGIIAVTLGLLLAGVQMAREAASRARCASNLRQIGLAAANYESTWAKLPDGGSWQSPGMFGQVLPYVDAAGVKLASPWWSTSPVPVYFCPSRRGVTWGRNWWGEYALGDYGWANIAITRSLVWCGGFWSSTCETAVSFAGWAPQVVVSPPHQFCPQIWRRRTTIADIADGASNTLLVSEKQLGAAWRDGTSAQADSNIYGPGTYGTSLSPDRTPATDALGSPWGEYFGSAHPRGLNVLFVDGHVSHVSYAVSQRAWRPPPPRAGGEID